MPARAGAATALGHAGHHLARDARRREGQRFLAAAAETKGSPPFSLTTLSAARRGS
jgi:hypothetical protein